ncbi:hypothetical protein H9L01_04110 [Erysipelothrix inopinata]|uniref:Uncharacterized protein n=1 Tax=Erysipelothrix inopinata TaxID=225084 RepID=A0A7G9S122_9FIRM|nr:hypothetical protein [Erysipelothrix inopinata]QNN61547.1 hypothetical protein H9L01_04110 [Erysipelothrix inopinata]
MKRKTIIVVSSLLLIVAIFGLKVLSERESEPVITFKDNIRIVLGQKQYQEADSQESRVEEVLPIVRPQDVIISNESYFDEISFNKINTESQTNLMESKPLNTFQLGDHEGTLYARKGDKVSEFEFVYEVVEHYER